MIQQFGLPHHVKISVNGSEAAVLRGLSMPIPIIGFACNLPEFADETTELMRSNPDALIAYLNEISVYYSHGDRCNTNPLTG
jgi:hypothetical protein